MTFRSVDNSTGTELIAGFTTLVKNTPAGVVDGDLMYAIYYSDTTSLVGVPDGWRAVYQDPFESGFQIYWKVADSEAVSYTWDLSVPFPSSWQFVQAAWYDVETGGVPTSTVKVFNNAFSATGGPGDWPPQDMDAVSDNAADLVVDAAVISGGTFGGFTPTLTWGAGVTSRGLAQLSSHLLAVGDEAASGTDLSARTYTPDGDTGASTDLATWYVRFWMQVPADPPTNDDFDDALLIEDCIGTSESITINSATTEVDEVVGSNWLNGPEADQTIWFKWIAPAAGSVIFDTHQSTGDPGNSDVNGALDTTLAVWTGTEFADMVEVASNDDFDTGGDHWWSTVTFTATEGFTYWIQVGTFGSGYIGDVILDWSGECGGSIRESQIIDQLRTG